MKQIEINYSTPAATLHKLALQYKPDIPIKEKTTWIAILFHNTTNTSEITEKNNFMWLKCHGRITVKTLKFKYFERYPLEEIVLKQSKRQLTDASLVDHLVMRYPFNDRVVVLRAVEKEQAEKEQYDHDEEQLQVQVRTAAALHVHGAITIDSDEEDEGSGSKEDTEAEDDQASGPMSPLQHSRHATHGPYPLESHVTQPNIQQRGQEHDPSTTGFWKHDDGSPPLRFTTVHIAGLMSRIDALPEPQKSLALSTNDQICESCTNPMSLREWTHFGPKGGALCTDCTKAWLTFHGDHEGCSLVERMVEEEYITKRQYQDHGYDQDLNENAPLNHPAQAERGDDIFHDPLQADALGDYKEEVQWEQWARNSGSRSPAMFENASETHVSPAKLVRRDPETGLEFEVFLAEDDEDFLDAQHAENNDAEAGKLNAAWYVRSPEREMEDAGDFDPSDWITPVEETKMRKAADYDEDYETDGEIERDDE